MNDNKPNFNDFAAQAREIFETLRIGTLHDPYLTAALDKIIALHEAALRQAATDARIDELEHIEIGRDNYDMSRIIQQRLKALRSEQPK